jgi:hypothetical protein
MGSLEVPAQSSETIKVPTAHYEFGANFLDPKVCSMVFNIIVASVIMMYFLTRFAMLREIICS